MHSFQELSVLFNEKLAVNHFPAVPATLYRPAEYFIKLGGKRIRPLMCLMGNELFAEIKDDAYHTAIAIELFHNFTLIHDDIMDKAPLRRGMQTVHARYGEPTALLAGDVMLVVAYDYLNKVQSACLRPLIQLFNLTARQVCEGQQLDMDFEKAEQVNMDEYIRMIELKTSVLLAASLRMGAMLGDAGAQEQQHLYNFGKNLGLSFQIQDDYLDAFGDQEKFGKLIGGDIMAGKKTFLLVKALEVANTAQQKELQHVLADTSEQKIPRCLSIFRECGVDKWAIRFKQQYMDAALACLNNIKAAPERKLPVLELADFLIRRES